MKHTNYSKQAFKDNLIYPESISGNVNPKGIFIPYCYLHGKLQSIAGYDLYSANSNFLLECLQSHIFLASVLYKRKKYKCIVFNDYSHNYRKRMVNYVVLLDDIQGVKDAIVGFPNLKLDCSGHTALDFIKKNYPEIYKLVKY